MPDTTALTNFRALLGLAGELLALEATYTDPPPAPDLDKVRGLRGGAAVLMVAAFETYLKTGVAEILQSLVKPPARHFSTLPEALRIASVFESLELALYGPRHGKSGKKKDRLADITAAAARIAAGHIDPSAVSQTKSNPGADTVAKILKSAGLHQPFQRIRATFDFKWGKPESASFVADKLDEIVQRRHRVAHSADASTISRVDLSTGRIFLLTLAETIDADLQAHVTAL